MGVPDILLSGDHAKVDAWRRQNAVERTCRWRPDLISTAELTADERAYAEDLLERLDASAGKPGSPLDERS